MNIVVLDGYACNPGDLSWAPLEELGAVTVYPRSNRAELKDRVAGADVLIINKVVCDKELLDWADACKMIAVTATGYNVVDLDECAKRGITVCNVPAYSTPDVAQHTFALLLELALHVGRHADDVMAGGWTAAKDFTYSLTPLMELSGKTFGIIGMGSIGQAVATIAAAFGMKVIFVNRSPKPQCETASIRQVTLDELYAASDVISLHAPATTDTTGMINEVSLATMKDSVFLINTARGNLVVEADVAAALKSGKLGGYGADVVLTEPMAADNPLFGCTDCNIVLTPHVAWATHEARSRCLNVTIDNVLAFAKGTPQNVVS